MSQEKQSIRGTQGTECSQQGALSATQETASATPSSPLSPGAPPPPPHTHFPQQASKTTPHPVLRAAVPQHTHRGKRPLKNTMGVVPSSISLHFSRGSESHSGKYKSRNFKTFSNFLNANIIVLYPKAIPQNIRKKVLTPQKNLAIPRTGKFRPATD